jgi:hypothetical protein
MASTITRRLRRILTPPPTHDKVHFHINDDGRPFVCDFDRCDSAALTLDEVAPRGRA